MKIFPIMALVGFLAALETAIPLWRSSAPTSSAPVFSLPMMDEAMKSPGEFQKIVDAYQADRGGELKLSGADGTSLTLFYFEWDEVEANPMTEIAGHTPEECNVAAGFTLKSRNPSRSFVTADHDPLLFDVTTFADPAGHSVHVYKAAWIQGLGSWDIRNQERFTRLNQTFSVGRGAARVIECGVTGAQDEFHAWQLFKSDVLSRIKWTQHQEVAE